MPKNNEARTCFNSLYFTDRLTESMSSILERQLTVIEAPVGYGKTTAVREYLKSKPVDTVWITLTGENETDFWQGFCAELGKRFSQYGETAEALISLGFPYDAACAGEALRLISDMEFERDAVIVVDDYHRLNTPETGHFIERLAEARIDNLHGVLITRDSYKGNAGILSLKGYASVIGRDTLALNEQEIKAFSRTCGIQIDEAQARSLYEITEGWLSAVYLNLLRYRNEGVLSISKDVENLMETEVYRPMPESMKDFLLHISIPEQFTFGQADYVWKNGGTEAFLYELQSKNTFIDYDAKNKKYTLHGILRGCINHHFDMLPEQRRGKIRTLHGDFYLREGRMFSAIEAFYAAGDFEKALAAIEADKGDCMTTERWSFLLKIITACPEEIKDAHIGALFIYAFSAYSVNDYETLASLMERLSAILDEMPDTPEINALRGNLEFIYSLMAFNEIEVMSAHHRKANALLGGKPLSLFDPSLPTWSLGSPSVLFMFHRSSGGLSDEIRQMKECMPHYYELAKYHGAGAETIMEAETRFFAGDFENAEILCHMGRTNAEMHRQMGNVLCALFLQARLAAVGGDFEKLEALTLEMRGIMEKDMGQFPLLHTVELCEGYVYALLGQSGRIPAWLKTGEPDGSRLFVFALGFYYFVYGAAMLIDGEYAKLIGVMSAVLELGAFEKNLLFNIYAYIYIAAANVRLGRESDAATHLALALSAALPDEIYMPFVSQGEILRPALTAAAGTERYAAGVARILELSDDWAKTKRRIVTRYFSDGKPVLTKREMQIALLVSEGRTNKDIAEELYIAPTTVKKTMTHIFNKLGVYNRSELQKAVDALKKS